MKRLIRISAAQAILAPTLALACIFPDIYGRGFPSGDPVYFSFVGNISGFQQSCIQQGFEKWNGLNGVYVQPTPQGATPTVTVRVAANPDPGYYAIFYPTQEDGSQHIIGAEMHLNGAWNSLSTCLQFQSIAMHELGHGFGLADAEGIPWSDTIMGGDISAASANQDWSPSECDWRRAEEADTFIGPTAPGPLPEKCTKGGEEGRTDSSGCCNLYYELQVSPSGNIKPVGHIMAPLNNTVLPTGSSGQVRLDVQDVDGSVYRVDWFTNNVYSHTSFSPPFSAPYSNAPAGTYAIKAALYDTAQEYSWSSTITLTVGNYAVPDTLESGGKLWPNGALESANGQYYVHFGLDGNLVLYTAAGAPVAWSGTYGPPAFVEMHVSGNAVISFFPANPQVAFQTFTGGIPNVGAGLRVLNSGKLAIIRRDGSTAWQYP